MRTTRPRRPQTNGKIERFHRILLEERASIRPWTSENQTPTRRRPLHPLLQSPPIPRRTRLGHTHRYVATFRTTSPRSTARGRSRSGPDRHRRPRWRPGGLTTPTEPASFSPCSSCGTQWQKDARPPDPARFAASVRTHRAAWHAVAAIGAHSRRSRGPARTFPPRSCHPMPRGAVGRDGRLRCARPQPRSASGRLRATACHETQRAQKARGLVGGRPPHRSRSPTQASKSQPPKSQPPKSQPPKSQRPKSEPRCCRACRSASRRRPSPSSRGAPRPDQRSRDQGQTAPRASSRGIDEPMRSRKLRAKKRSRASSSTPSMLASKRPSRSRPPSRCG